MADSLERDERFWDRIADFYDRLVEKEYAKEYKRFRKIFFKYVKRKHKVLDVATGTGDIAFVLAKRSKDVTGVDISSDMITQAKAKVAKNPKFLVHDAHDLGLRRGGFDLVTCCNGLLVMKDPAKALKEMRRVLKNGGKLVTITHSYADASFGHRMHLFRMFIKLGKPPHWHSFKGKALRKMHTEAGFKVLKAEYCWKDPHVVLVVARK